jgi:glycosyltransferase involved in cell wall biosynthesis
LARLFKIPSVREVNGIYTDELKAQKRGERISLWILDRIERFSMPKANRIISVTAKLKSVLQEEYGVPENKLAVIPNGANVDLFRPIETRSAINELRLSPNYRYICFVGNLVKWLGIENLINAAPLITAELPETKLLIVGDGELREELQRRVGELGVADKIIFTGMVPYERVPLYINAADICVIPIASDHRNSRMGASPLKLHEYMACGKPVIAGYVEGDIQELEDSGSGLIIDSTDAEEMARAIVTLLKNAPMIKEMGARARQIAIDKYSWKRNAEHVAEVCQSVIDQYPFKRRNINEDTAGKADSKN